MNLPKSINVSGINYVVDTNGPTVKERDNSLGTMYYSQSKIEIASDMSDARKADVLVHEIMHAIWCEAGFDDHDEDTVNRTAHVLYQVLRDNDFGWLRGGGE